MFTPSGQHSQTNLTTSRIPLFTICEIAKIQSNLVTKFSLTSVFFYSSFLVVPVEINILMPINFGGNNKVSSWPAFFLNNPTKLTFGFIRHIWVTNIEQINSIFISQCDDIFRQLWIFRIEYFNWSYGKSYGFAFHALMQKKKCKCWLT